MSNGDRESFILINRTTAFGIEDGSLSDVEGRSAVGKPWSSAGKSRLYIPRYYKKRSQASLMCVCVEIGEMFPDIFIKCQLLDYCLPLFETSMTLHCCFIGHISGSIFTPIVSLLYFFPSFFFFSSRDLNRRFNR